MKRTSLFKLSDSEVIERRREQRRRSAEKLRAERRAALPNFAPSIPSVTRFVDGYAVSVARVSILDGARA